MKAEQAGQRAPSTATVVDRALAPRPLPLHLATAFATWTSSIAALPGSRSGWLASNGAPATARSALGKALESVPAEAFARALSDEATHRAERLLAGLEAYRRHPYRRALQDPPAIWSEGVSRLLDYGQCGTGAGGGRPVLVVPSLVNRGYVLDLSEERSLLRWLTGRGLRPMLVDWGRPGAEERGLGLDGLIAGRLARALDAARAAAGEAPLVLGYCMGGLLAIALAVLRPKDVAGLALLATPWDFHADGEAAQARALAASIQPFWPLFDTMGEMPVDAIQALFARLDPYLAVRKFTAFAGLDPASPKARAFVALEDWLNDGVPLPAPVARACIVGWYGENLPGACAWRVAGQTIDPARLDHPALVLIPAQDRIVPPPSAEALAAALPRADVRHPPLGHIGMVVGGRARRSVWEPLAAWLEKA